MRLTGYSSPEYKEVYKKHGEILDDYLIRDQIDISTIYPFVSRVLLIPYKHTGKSRGLVSGTFVTNPLIDYDYELDGEKYKEHFFVDLSKFSYDKLPENHKRNIKKAISGIFDDTGYLTTEVATRPDRHYADVYYLYKNLIKRHDIKETSFTHYDEDQMKQLLSVPGTVLFKTFKHNSFFHVPTIVNYSLFYIDESDVYYHLSCQSNEGYKFQSNFMMMYTAIEFFKGLGFNRLLLGSVPDGSNGDGLRRFKKGFSTDSTWNYIIKYVYDQKKYDILSKNKSGDFFPLYRSEV